MSKKIEPGVMCWFAPGTDAGSFATVPAVVLAERRSPDTRPCVLCDSRVAWKCSWHPETAAVGGILTACECRLTPIDDEHDRERRWSGQFERCDYCGEAYAPAEVCDGAPPGACPACVREAAEESR